MEAILTAYRILFNIEFALTGYRDDLRSFIKVIPDARTRALYTRYSIQSRSQKNAATVLIEVEPQGSDENKPMFMLPDNEVFRYNVKVTDQAFLNRTHLASYDFTNQVLMLTNEANHKVGSDVLLSTPVVGYNSAGEYKKGYIVHSAGSFYKALKESSNSNQHDVGDTDYWRSITEGDTLVSQADLKNRASLTEWADLDAVMLLEIWNKPSLTTDYQLLDGAFKCREVSYRIKLQT